LRGIMYKFKMHTSDLDESFENLTQFHQDFALNFCTKTSSIEQHSLKYLHGILIEQGRGNMVKYAKKVPDTDNQALQNFISKSPWDEKPVIKQIQDKVIQLIGDENNGSLHLDESGYKKYGNHSVGVKRQYCGRLGKVDNCQVGVFMGYANENHRTLIDERLYLPEDWANDPIRRIECGVPEDVVFKTKGELALEMLLDAEERKIPFAWVGMDCFYGQQPWLLENIDKKGITYIADIPCNTRVWLDLPKTEIPEKKGNRGRNPTRERIADGEPEPIKVQKLAYMLDSPEASRVFLRDTERKELWCQIVCLRVYPVQDELPGKETFLILRRNEGEKEIKYQFSNASADTNIERLGQMSCSRYWIERAFQDAKGNAGMADYQVRSWTGWHHHMVMTMLAMLFIMDMQIKWGKKASMLSVMDVKEIFEVIMPKKEFTKEEVLAIIEQKHRVRLSARKSHHRRNKKQR
jgi:SRSO17 transposase